MKIFYVKIMKKYLIQVIFRSNISVNAKFPFCVNKTFNGKT